MTINTEQYTQRQHQVDKQPLVKRGLLHEKLPHDSYYYPAFWGSYKGFVKGALGGILIGAILGGVIGAGAFAITAAVSGTVAFSAIHMAASAAIVSTIGMFKGFHEFTNIGASAGVGVAMDELQVRQSEELDAKLKNLYKNMCRAMGKNPNNCPAYEEVSGTEESYDSAASGTPHMDSAAAISDKKFHFKVGMTGLVVGAAMGGLLVLGLGPALLALEGSAVFSGMELLAHGILTTGGHLSTGVTAAVIASTGLFGMSFGLDRKYFRNMFDVTDKAFLGTLFGRSKEKSPELQHTQPVAKRSHAEDNTDLDDISEEVSNKWREFENNACMSMNCINHLMVQQFTKGNYGKYRTKNTPKEIAR